MAELSSDASQHRRLRSFLQLAGKPRGVLTSTLDGCVLHGNTGARIRSSLWTFPG